MEPRYERNIPALTEAECLALREKRVLVVGCGGLGGHLIDLLARIGVGHLRVADGDVFELSNLNRQLLSSVPLLGVNKAKAAADHVARVNPDVTVEAVETYLTESNVSDLLADVLNIQRKEVNILLINGFHQKPETEVKDEDIVSLFPAVGGG